MRVRWCWLVLACVLGFTATGSAEPPPSSVITIATSFAYPLDESTQTQLRKEMDDLLSDDVVRLQWRDLDAGPVRDAFSHLVVATFVGNCAPYDDDTLHEYEPVLGFTHVSDGKIIPFLQIDCDRVSAILRLEKSGPTRAQKIEEMGRALAHVLAHEVFHVVMESKTHSRCGLAKAQLTRADLVSPSVVFEKADLERLRRKLGEAGGRLTSEVTTQEHDCSRGDAKERAER